MNKTPQQQTKKKTWLMAALFALSCVAPASAQTTYNLTNSLASLGSDNYTILIDNELSYTHASSSLTILTPHNLGGTVGGSFTAAPYDWTAYTDTNSWNFGLLMSALTTSPNLPFTIELFDNSGSFGSINKYQGIASGLTNTPTFVPVFFSEVGSGDMSSVGALQFTWDGGGTGTVVVDSFAAAQVVPEPSTWALITLGSSLVGGVALRRRLQARK